MRLVDDDPDIPPQINIVPAIDVIFSILTFFIIGTLFLTRNEGLPVNLPQAATGVIQQQNRITVSIDDRGNLALDREEILLEQLEARVIEMMQTENITLVAIQADRRIDHGRVIAVMDRLRQISGLRLAIATEPLNPSEP